MVDDVGGHGAVEAAGREVHRGHVELEELGVQVQVVEVLATGCEGRRGVVGRGDFEPARGEVHGMPAEAAADVEDAGAAGAALGCEEVGHLDDLWDGRYLLPVGDDVGVLPEVLPAHVSSPLSACGPR